MDPSRWLLRGGVSKQVSFNRATEYLAEGSIRSDFSKLDLSSLTTLDLREKQPQ